MNQAEVIELRGELTSYVDEMVSGLGRSEWRGALGLYLQGLLLDGERKSTQPMAARLAEQPGQADAIRQRL